MDGVPALLVYLGIGLALGEAGLGIRFEDYHLTGEVGLVALAVILAEGGHSPHSEPATADNVTRIAAAFVDRASGAGSREKPAPPAAPAGSAQ